MLIFLPTGLLIVTLTLMIIMYRRDFSRGLIWSAGAIGSLATIIVSLFLIRQLPLEVVVRGNQTSVYSRLPVTLLLDGTAWAYQTALLVILSAVLLTATRRQATSGPEAWMASAGITILGLVAIQAGTLSTLLGAWFLIDTLELIYLLVSLKPQHNLGKLVTSFSLRYAGILVGLISIGTESGESGFLILLAAMLRLGVLPFWSYWGDFSAITGLGTIMQAVRVLSALTPLARPARRGKSTWN